MVKKKVEEEIVEQISDVNINDLLSKNIYDYGIDILEDRVLADFRDGFKPAQRRILWTARDLKAYPDSKTVKSARITGDCMGKYHPHSSAYGSLVNLVNSDYPVLQGQGNFGDINNGPAAERYTEARISEIGMKCLECMPVADLVPNYGGDLMEPVVIPSRFPNFFVNDCSGIAVGLKCDIPAHNLEEIVEAFKMIIRKGQAATINDLMKYIKGPDYAYGGKLLSTTAEIAELYKNGEGSLKYECEYTLVPEGNKWLLTITGYCPNFAPESFINKMLEFVKTGDIVYVNDSANKSEKVKLEVLIKNKEFFESKIHKLLIKTCNYRFYAIQRNKSTTIDKDVQVDILVPNMLELMTSWIEWRKDIETKMTKRELELTTDKEYHLKTKESAVQNLSVIKDALEDNNPVNYIVNNLPYLKTLHTTNAKLAKELAEYLMDQKLTSIRKLDLNKLQKELVECQKKTASLNTDLADISKVVLRELDKLKVFYKARALKV